VTRESGPSIEAVLGVLRGWQGRSVRAYVRTPSANLFEVGFEDEVKRVLDARPAVVRIEFAGGGFVAIAPADIRELRLLGEGRRDRIEIVLLDGHVLALEMLPRRR
jgi:hypothetical protein